MDDSNLDFRDAGYLLVFVPLAVKCELCLVSVNPEDAEDGVPLHHMTMAMTLTAQQHLGMVLATTRHSVTWRNSQSKLLSNIFDCSRNRTVTAECSHPEDNYCCFFSADVNVKTD